MRRRGFLPVPFSVPVTSPQYLLCGNFAGVSTSATYVAVVMFHTSNVAVVMWCAGNLT
ncbi:hypothetical protein Patl1_34239 [Pistacia atlantica]|uniref:Uncharacterized protein n=1 Tax=Pistacia atlantica TaxID=434234 RepID=A0ACC0ZSS6_9ROSI|nr:hypothetical protein Patl1_34239 [Pistacia atlantica]